LNMQTRLSRNLEKKTKQRLFINVFGTLIILFLLVKFGIPAVVNLSLLMGGAAGGNDKNAIQLSSAPILPPLLNSTFNATNSASVSISGSATQKITIKLYVNNNFVDSSDTKDDGSFYFDHVTLSAGENIIQAKSRQNNKESDFSKSITIIYASKAPSLSLDSPSDGQTFSKDSSSVLVKGKTDPDVRVTVNDFWAIVDGAGNYSYNLKLQNGDNQIHVVAQDIAGNKSEKIIKVNYSQ
jgi:bacillopeptidase F